HAMNYALDIEAIVQTVFMGTQQRATGPIGGLVWGSAADRLPTFPHNPARAAELLAEAGFADGFAVTFFAPQGATVTIDTAEIVQNMLAPFGIQVSVQILEWGAFLEASNRGETDILSLAWVPTTGDPDQGLFATFHSSMHGAGGNRAFFTNAQVDALLEAGRVETDPVARAQIYYEIQQILREESPWIFFAQGIQALGIRNNVQGFRMSPNLINRFWGVSFS
ncbi:MAG: ABC transporter substrate-binding protein, partial [Spirochaetes bacterium]|nr:ABC transporter substrate-binding protein [Spirochaetota bacterium]